VKRVGTVQGRNKAAILPCMYGKEIGIECSSSATIRLTVFANNLSRVKSKRRVNSPGSHEKKTIFGRRVFPNEYGKDVRSNARFAHQSTTQRVARASF
jgi:hypothetical protein